MSPEINRKKEVSYSEFLAAWEPFSRDLEIVGEEDRLVPLNPFGAPPDNFDEHGHHNYHLTIWKGEERKFKDKLSRVKAVVVGCMDWRFAKDLYAKALAEG